VRASKPMWCIATDWGGESEDLRARDGWPRSRYDRPRFSGVDAETLHGPYTGQHRSANTALDLYKCLKGLVAGVGFRTHRLALAA
jgi:hypothetical protein